MATVTPARLPVKCWDDRLLLAVLRRAADLGLRRESAVLVTIQSYARAHRGRLPYPSQETLATRLRMSARQVRRYLLALEAAGLVGVFRTCARPSGPGGRLTRRTNRYYLVAAGLRRRSHLGDMDDPRSPSGGAEHAAAAPADTSPGPAPPVIGAATAEESRLVDLGAAVLALRRARGWLRRG